MGGEVFKNKYSNFDIKYLFKLGILALIIFLILSVFNSLFIYVVLLLSLTMVLFSDPPHIFYLLLTLFPYAIIMKIDVDDNSFFTVIFLFSVLKIIFYSFINNKNVSKVDILLLVLTISLSLYSLSFETSVLIKLISGIVFLLFIINYEDKIVDKKMIIYFSIGSLSASVLGLFTENILRLQDFIQHDLGPGANIRFSGLNSDPNFYNIEILLIMSTLLLLLNNGKINKVYMSILFTICFIFGLLTFSKSFLLFFVIMMVLYLLYKKSFKTLFNTSILLLVMYILITLISDENILLLLLSRFSGASNLNDLTTSRVSIWSEYIIYLSQNPIKLIFGNGLLIDYLNNKASHNTIIQVFYTIGFVGFIGFSLLLIKIFIFNNKKKDIINLLPLIMFALSSFFLDYLFDHRTFIFLAYCYLVMKKDKLLNDYTNKLR